MMKLLPVFCAAILLGAVPGFGANRCSHQYDLLGNIDHTFWILERVGHDCSGSHLMKLSVVEDSVHVERTRDWKALPDQATSRQVNRSWEEGERATARSVHFSALGWSIAAPDPVSGKPSDLPVRREPQLTGFTGTPVFWTGAGGHINYELRDALVSSSGRYLLLITHSSWSYQGDVYRLPDDPGDGLILLRCQDGEGVD